MPDIRTAITKAILGGKPGGPHPGGIAVYHSSPHDFDKFDWSKLRTGEGANTYGAGFYFAENPAVSGQGGQYWKQFAPRFEGTPEGSAAFKLKEAGFDRAKAIADAEEKLARAAKSADQFSALTGRVPYEGFTRDQRAAFELLKSGKPVGPRTYEVNINARPELMLDWDKPLAQMSPDVQARLKDAWLAHPDAHSRQTGEQIYQNAQITHHQPGRGHEDAVIASQKLAEAGIPGIRYLDAGSRGGGPFNVRVNAPDQFSVIGPGNLTHQTFADRAAANALAEAENAKLRSYNYVVTDPSRLDIMAKYGVAGGVPMGMGAVAAQDQYGAQQ